MLPHPLPNFKLHKYYQNEPKFNAINSRINLLKIKDSAYVVNVDEYESIETHWIALHVNGSNRIASYDAKYFYGFGVEHIPKKI